MDIRTLEKLAETTRSICNADSRLELRASLQRGFSSFGFESFNLGCHKSDKHELALNPTLATWPDEFMSEYERRNWADSDPILARAATTETPFIWSIQNKYKSRPQQSYIDFLHSSPLKGGVSIPLPRRPGTLSSISVEIHTETRIDGWTIHAASVIANSAMIKAEALGLVPDISVDESQHLRKLSKIQSEILKWAASGKSNGDIAVILNSSERAVKYHMSEILRKLGVATRTQAIARVAGRA